MAAIVVQLGLAMMPRPAATTSSMADGLTSLTTSGISGSLRYAELLSMTTTPASTNDWASARDVVAPAEKIAMSRPVGSAVEASSTVTSRSPKGSTVPAERAEAKKRTSSIGKSRSRRISRTATPTWPVAPTMPRRTPLIGVPAEVRAQRSFVR